MILTLTKKYTYPILLAVGFLIFFHHLSQPGFFLDGLIYAALGKNAAVKGAWLVPTMNEGIYQEFSDHIPFMLILEGIFFKVLGVSFFTARLLVSIFSFATFASIIYFTRKNTTTFKVVITTFIFLLTYPLLRHSRHPNYDNPLMLMCFLSISFYIRAIANQLNKDWFLTGIFFGFAMLFKGPMAVFIPLTIFIHLLVTKNLKLLKDKIPWLAFLIGLLIFSIWPLALYLNGQFYIFTAWFNFTFIGSIAKSRGVISNDYFTYIRYLFTFTPLHMLLAIFTFYQFFRTKWSEFYRVHFIFFSVVLILTSLMKFKLSHYITALYPSLAIIACLGLKDPSNEKIQSRILLAMLLIGSVVFIYPQDYKKTRDYEIFEIRRVLNEKSIVPSLYIVEKGAYPFWSLFALVEFVDGLKTYEIPTTDLKMDKREALYIVNEHNTQEFNQKCTFIYNLVNYKSNAYFCR